MDFNVFRSKRDTAINGCRPKRDKWTRPDVDCSSFSSSSSPSLWAHRGARQEACLLLTATQRHLSKQCPALLSTQKNKGDSPLYMGFRITVRSGHSGHSKCGPGMEFWELEEHEVAYSWLRAFKMWPGNGVLGTRRPRSGLQLAPGIQNVAQELCSGNATNTK